jgi:hypothetical protein
MFTRQLTKPFQATIAAGALSALFAAAPAQAADQSAWLQEQISISDGGTSLVSFATGGNTGLSYPTDTQSEWLQGQLASTDGSSPYIRGDAEPVYAAPHPGGTATTNMQFAFVERGLQTTDGSNP